MPLIIFSHFERKLLLSGLLAPGVIESRIDASKSRRVFASRVSTYSIIFATISPLDILSNRFLVILGRMRPAKSERSEFEGKARLSRSMSNRCVGAAPVVFERREEFPPELKGKT